MVLRQIYNSFLTCDDINKKVITFVYLQLKLLIMSKLANDLINQVKTKNPNETEFLQAVEEVIKIQGLVREIKSDAN